MEEAKPVSDDIPKVVLSGMINILGVDLICHVLDNGRRLFEAESIDKLFETLEKTSSVISEEDALKIAKFIKG